LDTVKAPIFFFRDEKLGWMDDEMDDDMYGWKG
jgi:hypothetical protein